MVLAAAETSLLLQLDEVADYVVGMNKANFASEFEKGPINVLVEKKRAPSPRDVKEFDTFSDEEHNSNRESNFQNTQLSKSDIDLTGVSSYSAFLAENVIKSSSLTGLYQTKQIAKTKTHSWQNASRTSSCPRDAINTPKCSGIQTGETSEPSSSRDSISFSRPAVTSSSRRVVAVVLLCAWLVSRLILPTTSSLGNDVNMQVETVIMKDTRSEGSSAASLLELEEAISRSAPNLIAVQQKNSQAAMPSATKEQSPPHQSLRNSKMRRHREVKRDELQPKTDV